MAKTYGPSFGILKNVITKQGLTVVEERENILEGSSADHFEGYKFNMQKGDPIGQIMYNETWSGSKRNKTTVGVASKNYWEIFDSPYSVILFKTDTFKRFLAMLGAKPEKYRECDEDFYCFLIRANLPEEQPSEKIEKSIDNTLLLTKFVDASYKKLLEPVDTMQREIMEKELKLSLV